MSEGTHSVSKRTAIGTQRKLSILMAGTALALLTGGVLYQVFRGEEGVAADNTAGAVQGGEPGTVRISAPSGQPRHLAKVNDELISWELVARECMARHGREVLENIINHTIIQQACNERGIVISRDEVDREVVQISKKFNLTVLNWYDMLARERNLSPAQYRRDIIWPMLALKKIAGEKVEVTEEDLRIAFERDFGERIEARMIMLGNIRRAQEVAELAMKNPENFERLAKERSIESSSRVMGGVIPPIRRHAGSKALEKEAFKLHKGEISAVVQINPTQFVILKCEGRTKPDVTFEEQRESIYEYVLEEKIQESVAKIFKNIKKDAVVHNFLTKTTTGRIRKTAGIKNGNVRSASGGRSRKRSPRTSRRSKSPRRLTQ